MRVPDFAATATATVVTDEVEATRRELLRNVVVIAEASNGKLMDGQKNVQEQGAPATFSICGIDAPQLRPHQAHQSTVVSVPSSALTPRDSLPPARARVFLSHPGSKHGGRRYHNDYSYRVAQCTGELWYRTSGSGTDVVPCRPARSWRGK